MEIEISKELNELHDPNNIRALTGQFRIYTLEIVHEKPLKCEDINSLAQEKASTGRTLRKFSTSSDDKYCIINLQFKCWSCGKNSMKNFRRQIRGKFPGADLNNIKRQRK